MSTHTPSPPPPTQAGGGRPRRRWLIALLASLAVVIVVVAVIGVLVFRELNPPVPACAKAADPTRSGAISQYCPDGYQSGSSMTVGPDGAVWFQSGAQQLARMTPQSEAVTVFAAPSAPNVIAESSLVRGGDGAIWYIANDKVGRVTPSGQVTDIALPKEMGLARSVVAGPDGTLWVNMWSDDPAQKGGLVRVPTTGATAGSPVIMLTWSAALGGIGGGAGAPDGSLWLPTPGGVTRVAPTGSITKIPLNIPGGLAALTAGPDGTMWFIAGNGRAGRITLTGAVTYFGSASTGKTDSLNPIIVGPDGNLWFSYSQQRTIGRITPSGVVTKFTAPDAQSINNMTSGPDGGVWFLAWYPSGGFGSPFGRITRITP